MSRTIKVIQTAQDTGDKLTQKADVPFEADTQGVENKVVNIYPEVEYQEIEGFGGAFTESASVTLDKLSREARGRILDAYFNPITGLGYTLCRTHINSCDFSTGNYACDEVDGDVELKLFNLDRDRKSLIPMIRDAMAVKGADFRLFASPWSPPAWMKTSGMMNQGGKLKPEYRDVWARYFARFIQGYAAEGIAIWGVTVQNEPKAVQTWDSCVYTAEEERDFVRDYLGPVLEREGLGDIRIMVWDHNKERIYERARTALLDAEAARYIWGTAFHWYSGDHFEALSMVHDRFPQKKLLFTEGCVGKSVKPGLWSPGERYAHDIIGNLNNWAAGWVDWNLLLDETGGPNHVGNFCDAPVIADTRSKTVHLGSSYYYIGHFSRFIRPGARRIGWSRYTDKLETTAFKNTNGEIVVVIMNRCDEEIPLVLRCAESIAELASPAHSIVTLRFARPA
jgi:glucosylceramidase